MIRNLLKRRCGCGMCARAGKFLFLQRCQVTHHVARELSFLKSSGSMEIQFTAPYN